MFEQILNWGKGGHKGKRIFDNILKRNLYKCLGYIKAPIGEELKKEFKGLAPSVILLGTKIDYGKGTKNPLNSALFYNKDRQDVLFKHEFQEPIL